MANDVVVNGVTYPDVEMLEMTSSSGEKVAFYPDAVRYNPQSLTEEQKAQARGNIGAADTKSANQLSKEIDAIKEDLPYYVATDYGISTGAEDNTSALQALVNEVSAAGGGIIFFPVGTYKFAKANDGNTINRAIEMKSKVSIIGESVTETIFRQVGTSGFALFEGRPGKSTPLTGCTFSNFTVYGNGNEAGYIVQGKAFFFQYVRDCIFRDLILKETVATALGIDFIDRTVIDNVTCIGCGRTWSGGGAGCAGIGIGTGQYDNENFIITNCTCIDCGQFGIFIENQSQLANEGTSNFTNSRGCIISNCIVRNGRNHGIGIKGGKNVTVEGCEVYDNAHHGIYLAYCCDGVKILNCEISRNGINGVYSGVREDSKRVVVKGNLITDNAQEGIVVNSSCEGMSIAENYTAGNTMGLKIPAIEMTDTITLGNAFLDNTDISAVFAGNTDYNQFIKVVEPTSVNVFPIEIGEGETSKIKFAMLPANAEKAVVYESSDENVATVDDNGVVTAVGVGYCQITVRSSLVNNVYGVTDCNVVASYLYAANSAMKSNVVLDESGTEVSQSGARTTDYISVINGFYMARVTNSVLDKGFRVIAYDSDKNIIGQTTKKSGYGTCVFAYPSMAYIRISFTSNVSANLYLYRVTPFLSIPASQFIATKKINPDGAEAYQSNACATDYIGVSFPTNKHIYSLAGGYSSNNMRIAQYNSDKTSLSTSFAQWNAYKPTEITPLDGVVFIRIGITGTATQQDATLYSCHTSIQEVN